MLQVVPEGRVTPRPSYARRPIQGQNSSLKFQGFRFPAGLDVKVGNADLPDIIGRLMVLTIYLPQGTMAIINREKPFETWGRNALAWAGSILVTMLTKHPTFGFNAIFNQFMVKRKPQSSYRMPKDPIKRVSYILNNPQKALGALINQFRPTEDYKELLKEAGARVNAKTHWAALKKEKGLLVILSERLEKQGVEGALKSKAINNLLKRMAVCQFLSIAGSSMFTSLVIGILLQKAVFKFISPLDKKYFPKDLPPQTVTPPAQPMTSPLVAPPMPGGVK